MRFVRALGALILLAVPLTAQSTRPATSDDYFNFKFVGDPQLSPDGKLVAYTVTRIDRPANRRVTSIWLASVDGSTAPRQLTASHLSSSGPRWRPDGNALAFTGTRPTPGDEAASRPQFYFLDLAGGGRRAAPDHQSPERCHRMRLVSRWDAGALPVPHRALRPQGAVQRRASLHRTVL